MTDRTDHYAESESLAATAEIRDSVDRTYATKTDIYLAAIHKSLLAIHDTLTAADRHATNEAKQREAAEPEWPEGFDGFRENHGWGLLTRAEKQVVIERWLADQKLTDDEREAKAAEARAKFATLVEQLESAQHEPTPEPDPLDENDHRDRLTADRQRIVRRGQEHWHIPATSGAWCDADCTETSLRDWAHFFGPLAFAPEPPSEDSSTHYYPTNIDRAPDGTAWSWGVAECHCNRPWRHE